MASDRETLSRVLHDADVTEPYTDAEWAVVWPEFPDSGMNRRVDAILASDWLRERDRRIKAEAMRETADLPIPLGVQNVKAWLRDRAARITGGDS